VAGKRVLHGLRGGGHHRSKGVLFILLPSPSVWRLVCYGCVCMDEVYVGPDYTAVLCYIEACNLPWITIPFLSSTVPISCTNCAKMRGFYRIPVLGLPWCIVFAISLKWHGGFLEDVDQLVWVLRERVIVWIVVGFRLSVWQQFSWINLWEWVSVVALIPCLIWVLCAILLFCDFLVYFYPPPFCQMMFLSVQCCDFSCCWMNECCLLWNRYLILSTTSQFFCVPLFNHQEQYFNCLQSFDWCLQQSSCN